ncbi:universal stress protein [Specibacter sp. RAF43]|uniref:universal stress protein n=1 Tax=Specibacter sp. RAF43 TaxID=3233057 RepID=UPI003F96C0D3
MPSTIIVGVDGSAASRTALDWAARRAQRFGSELQMVHSVPDDWASTADPLTPAAIKTVAHALEGERDRIAALIPPSTIHIVITRGEPAVVLGELSEGAAMVVVGVDKPADAHGEGFGAVDLQVVARSACTVAIIPGATGPGVGVVVGVDGSRASRRALRVAAGEAETSRQALTIVHAAVPAGRGWRFPQGESLPDGVVTEGEEILASAVAAVAARHPRLEVHRVLDTRHGPAEALANAAAGAGLLVVGGQGRGSVKRMRVGSVGSVLLSRIACPTFVTTGPEKPYQRSS